MKPIEPIPSLAIPTKYRGIPFKSRAEANWAAYFDTLGLSWEYEPFGESTFPDFAVGDDLLIEIKGALPHGVHMTHLEWRNDPDAIKARAKFEERFHRRDSRLFAIGFRDGSAAVVSDQAYDYLSEDYDVDLRRPESWTLNWHVLLPLTNASFMENWDKARNLVSRGNNK
jgi:hypothetical protein